MKLLALRLTLTGLLAGSLGFAAGAAPLKIELPPEKPAFKNAPGVDLVLAQCVTCHSTDYISIQPGFPEKGWKATVEKMQKKFGAPIPAEQTQAIVDYLAGAYGKPQPK